MRLITKRRTTSARRRLNIDNATTHFLQRIKNPFLRVGIFLVPKIDVLIQRLFQIFFVVVFINLLAEIIRHERLPILIRAEQTNAVTSVSEHKIFRAVNDIIIQTEQNIDCGLRLGNVFVRAVDHDELRAGLAEQPEMRQRAEIGGNFVRAHYQGNLLLNLQLFRRNNFKAPRLKKILKIFLVEAVNIAMLFLELKTRPRQVNLFQITGRHARLYRLIREQKFFREMPVIVLRLLRHSDRAKLHRLVDINYPRLVNAHELEKIICIGTMPALRQSRDEHYF